MNLDDLIARLSTLSNADRDWLLEALSPAAREQLLQLTRGEIDKAEASRAEASRPSAALPQPPAAALEASEAGLEPRSPTALIARLAAMPVAVLVEVLGAEPIWLTAALLCVAEWPWRAQLLQRLPHVAVCLCPPLETPGIAPTEHFTRALLERIVARAADVPEPATSRFESLVQKLATRRRRAAWQL
jgi:hypothetical protein